MRYLFLAVFAPLIVVPAVAVTSHTAFAKPSVFERIKGTWRGGGRIKLAGGRTRRISCRAYYTVRRTGRGLGLAIRCASSSNRIEIRASLTNNNGRLSGRWEERNFNASGSVSGSAKAGRINMRVSGSLNGSMRISFGRSQQSVQISTSTAELRGVSISLRRR